MGGGIIEASSIFSPQRDFKSHPGLSTPWYPWNDRAVQHITCIISNEILFFEWVTGIQYDGERKKGQRRRKGKSFLFIISLFGSFEHCRVCWYPPFQPIPWYCSPCSEFYHNNRGSLIAGHATGNNKSHLFYSSIHNTRQIEEERAEERREGGWWSIQRVGNNGFAVGNEAENQNKALVLVCMCLHSLVWMSICCSGGAL